MPDASDIHPNIDHVLEDLLARIKIVDRDQDPGLTCHRDLDNVRRLHRHLMAGGALPAQWRGEGTALAELAWGVLAAAGLLERNGFETMAALLRRRLAAVTGEG